MECRAVRKHASTPFTSNDERSKGVIPDRSHAIATGPGISYIRGRGDEGSRDTHFPVVTGGQTSHHPEMLGLHPFVFGNFADAAGLALHGGATTDRLGRVLVQAVEGAMHAARRSDRGGLLRTLGRTQSRGDIQGSLGRAQLARLQRQLVKRGGGEAGRSGRVIGGSGGGRVGR